MAGGERGSGLGGGGQMGTSAIMSIIQIKGKKCKLKIIIINNEWKLC